MRMPSTAVQVHACSMYGSWISPLCDGHACERLLGPPARAKSCMGVRCAALQMGGRTIYVRSDEGVPGGAGGHDGGMGAPAKRLADDSRTGVAAGYGAGGGYDQQAGGYAYNTGGGNGAGEDLGLARRRRRSHKRPSPRCFGCICAHSLPHPAGGLAYQARHLLVASEPWPPRSRSMAGAAGCMAPRVANSAGHA